MKLYEVTITFYVAAENEDQARHVAAFETPRFLDLWEIHEADGVNGDWWRVVPYGHGDDVKTCGDYMRSKPALEESPNAN